MGQYEFGKESMKVLGTVNKYLRLTAIEAIKNSAIDISVPEWGGYRTPVKQYELFNKGWSKADGYINKSDHQETDNESKSKALDLCAFFEGKQNWNKQRLTYISTLFITTFNRLKSEGKIPQDVYLDSGMLWSNFEDNMGWDLPHNAITNIGPITKIKS